MAPNTNAVSDTWLLTDAPGATCVAPPASLVSWWDGDEVSGTTAFDIQDGNDGTMIGGVGIVSGKVGNAFSFDGLNDYVEVADNANLDFGAIDSFSITAWFKQNPPSSFQRILIKNGPNGGSGIGRSFYTVPSRWTISTRMVTRYSSETSAYVRCRDPSSVPYAAR